MKKRIIALLICVFIVCTVSISLVACNNNENNYVGMYVGYVEGHMDIQLHITIKDLEESSVTGDYYPIAVNGIYPDNRVFCVLSSLYTDEQKIFLNPSSNDTYYLPSGDYELSKIVDNKFTLTLNKNGTMTIIHCKRTEYSKSDWEQFAYKTVDGGYEPYYYEN